LVSLSFVAVKESCGGGFLGFHKPLRFVRRCVKCDSEEGDLAWEGEMVDVIAKKGGWLLLGWDLSEEEDEVEQRKVQENVTAWVSGLKLFSLGLRPWVFSYEMDRP
ncbi:hypothetical protein CFP56_003197, partial [Quercus suber]